MSPFVTKFVPAVVILAGSAGLGGCATKSYVQEQIAPVTQRVAAIETQLQRELQQIDHALERIEAGTYGVCEVGGEVIPVERLEARPLATLCIQHQRERDEQEGGTTRTVV